MNHISFEGRKAIYLAFIPNRTIELNENYERQLEILRQIDQLFDELDN